MKRRATRSPLIEALAPSRRRGFLRAAATLVAAPLVPLGVRYALYEELVGAAHAGGQMTVPTYFLELNLRDQFDFMHAFVPPGLATHTGLITGAGGNQCTLFHDQGTLTQHPGNFYLTPDSQELAPHLDTIAVMELNELCVGVIHGHEAVNAMRSPGRSKIQGPGTMEVWSGEPGYTEGGNDYFYSSTPTPASLHNLRQKELTPQIRNGVAMKFVSRSHTMCHFGAGDAAAELDRVQSRDTLFQSFPDTIEDLNPLASAAEAELLAEAMKRVDAEFLQRYGFADTAKDKHDSNLAEAVDRFYSADNTQLVSLPLSRDEIAAWSPDVPDQVGNNIKAQIWEAMAWAGKLLTHGTTRSVAIEWDYLDVHESRDATVVSTMAKQFANPLARLIQRLKDAQIYDQTVIAVYSGDGGRSPAGNSYGNSGKNSLILCGRNVRGGYYGDVGVSGPLGNGHAYHYRLPDPATGALAPPILGNDRLNGAHAWRTVMKALEIPEADLQYPDVVGYAPLDFMLTN